MPLYLLHNSIRKSYHLCVPTVSHCYVPVKLPVGKASVVIFKIASIFLSVINEPKPIWFGAPYNRRYASIESVHVGSKLSNTDLFDNEPFA